MLLLPSFFAHEVYVLTPRQVAADKATKVDPLHSLSQSHDLKNFIIMGLAIGVSCLIALWLKSKQPAQKVGKFIDRATYFAPDLIRISLGASFIAAAHFHAVFGPELPVSQFSANGFIEPFLYISGLALILGIATRLVGALAAAFYIFAFVDQGWYLLTYLNYLGEALALVLIRRQNFSLDALFVKTQKQPPKYEQWSMPIARIMFGVSLLYAAINVKFVSPNVSLDVVNRYHLTKYFHFDPLFVVLGAGLTEILIAVLFILGLLQRLNSLVFITFITLSLFYFKESVWPHYLLLGLAAGIFLHKPDRLALDNRLFKLKRS